MSCAWLAPVGYVQVCDGDTRAKRAPGYCWNRERVSRNGPLRAMCHLGIVALPPTHMWAGFQWTAVAWCIGVWGCLYNNDGFGVCAEVPGC